MSIRGSRAEQATRVMSLIRSLLPSFHFPPPFLAACHASCPHTVDSLRTLEGVSVCGRDRLKLHMN